MSPLRYGSVCSGIEAASVAWHPLGWRAAFFSEIEPFPRAVLAQHWPDVPLHGDFTTIEASQYEPIELLVGGTPCQSFSVAGLRGGLADERGNLALQFLRLAQRLRPRWVVWENVPGVLSSTSHNAPDPCLPPDHLDQGAEWVGEDEYDADESHAFSCFLAGLSELGYGWAYRSLDAQFAGLAQRRERVFVVGCLGDWRRAVAVLFDRHSLSGHPAPRREAGQGTAGGAIGSLTGSGRGVERVGESRGQDPVIAVPLLEIGKGTTSRGEGPNGCGIGADGDPMYTLQAGAQHGIAHALRADGFDAGEDGTGRGTPLVPCEPMTLAIRGRGDTHNLETRQDGTANAILTPNGGRGGIGVGAVAIPFDTTQITSKANYSRPRAGDPCHPLAGGAHPPPVAFNWQSGGDCRQNPTVERTDPLQALQTPAVFAGMAVRRLTPRECERLQGFPDDYTLVSYRGKPASDGPRYKALGNSMAIPVVRWIGERIQMVENLEVAVGAVA